MNSAYFSGLLPTRPMATGMSAPTQPMKNSFLGQMAQVNQPAIFQQQPVGALPPAITPAMTPLPGMTQDPTMTPGRSSMTQGGALPQQAAARKPYAQPYTPIFRQQETM